MLNVVSEGNNDKSDNTLNLKVRTNKGLLTLPTLTKSACILDLKKKISDVTGYDTNSILIMKGYPPKPLDYKDSNQTLSDILLNTGDLLIVQETPNDKNKETTNPKLGEKGILIKRVVPADNSCLFTSFNFLLNNGADLDLSPECVNRYRRIVSETVLAFDPTRSVPAPGLVRDYDSEDARFLSELLTPAVLGKSTNSEYAKWISSPKSWGGAIELAVLSRHFSLEIVVVDIQSARLERFGRDVGYVQALLLLYDGIHYDPLVMEFGAGGNEVRVQTIFNTVDVESYKLILDEALEIASQAKKAHQYTAVGTFCLKCYECDAILVGESKAQEHAKKTGHRSFGEIKRD